MLTYELDERGNEPLYEYLYRRIRDDILAGTIGRDDPLPSKRALAKHLNISIMTVENAYAQLMTEGYIYSRPRSGFYAADVSDALRYRDETGGTGRERSAAESGTGLRGPHDGTLFADFSSNQTQPDSFPFTTWARLTRRILTDNKEQLMTNPPTGGVWELREAIAAHLKAFRGIEIESDQVIVGAGTEYLYGLILQILGLDRIYAVEDPGYRKAAMVCEAHAVQLRRIPLDGNGLSVKALAESGADAVHVTPAHHFPTGITMPAGRRYELLRWAAGRSGRYIVEDDYDSEFRLSGRPLPSLFGMDTADRVIYMNTFTKTLASTMRISYMILPRPLLSIFRDKLQFYSCTVPTFEQYTLACFIKEGHFEKHINRMRTLSRRKRDLLLESIRKSPISRIASVSEEHAGLHFLLTLRTDMPEELFMERLEENGIRLAPASDYYEQGAEKGTYIMNYSSVALEKIPEAIDRICRIVGERDAGKQE